MMFFARALKESRVGIGSERRHAFSPIPNTAIKGATEEHLGTLVPRRTHVLQNNSCVVALCKLRRLQFHRDVFLGLFSTNQAISLPKEKQPIPEHCFAD